MFYLVLNYTSVKLTFIAQKYVIFLLAVLGHHTRYSDGSEQRNPPSSLHTNRPSTSVYSSKNLENLSGILTNWKQIYSSFLKEPF